MVNYYDQVKGPQGDPEPYPYNTKWEDEARADAAADAPVAATAAAGTAANTGDVITSNGHGLVNGQAVVFSTVVSGLTVGTVYYVVASTANTFQVSLTPGGSAVALNADGAVAFTAAPKALVGTPFVPEHFFDRRDGAVTVQPVRASS